MKRMRKSRAAGAGYDSILDTMTNVVGILIIVVAVTQLSVADAVDRGSRGQDQVVAEVSEEALASVRSSAQELGERLQDLEERWAGLELKSVDRRIELEQLERAIRELSAEAVNPTPFHAREATLKTELASLERQQASVEDAERDALARIRELKASLDSAETPQLADRPQVRLPNPDPARSKGKKIYRFFCRNGKVYPVDETQLDKKMFAEIKRVAGSLKTRSVVTKLDEIKQHFGDNDFGDEFFRLKINGWKRNEGRQIRYSLSAEYTLRPHAKGATLEQLKDPASVFGRKLALLDDAKRWIYFGVWEDSFEAYLAARQVAERSGFAVGWTPYAGAEFGWSLSGSGGSGPGAIPD